MLIQKHKPLFFFLGTIWVNCVLSFMKLPSKQSMSLSCVKNDYVITLDKGIVLFIMNINVSHFILRNLSHFKQCLL